MTDTGIYRKKSFESNLWPSEKYFRCCTTELFETHGRLSRLSLSMETNFIYTSRIGISTCDAIAQQWCKWRRSILILVICFLFCFLVVSLIVLSRPKHDTTKFNKEGMTSQSKTHLSANERARTNLNFSSISYLGGYADSFVFTVSIRVSVCESNFWSFAMSAGWAENILFWNTSQYHPKEERKKQKTKE